MILKLVPLSSNSIHVRRTTRSKPKFDIPKTSPSYEEVVGRSIEARLEEFLGAKSYNSRIKEILPIENDWNKLCDFDDFIGLNIKKIDKNKHKDTCIELFNEMPELYLWLYKTAQQEQRSNADISVQYQCISLDWSRAYYRKSQQTEIPVASFNWRTLIDPDEIATEDEVDPQHRLSFTFITNFSKKPTPTLKELTQVQFTSSEIMLLDEKRANSVRLKMLRKSLALWKLELINTPANRNNKAVKRFNSILTHFLRETSATLQLTPALEDKAQVILDSAKQLIAKGITNTKNDFNGFPVTLKLFIDRMSTTC